jgi:fatty acid desaturase
MDTRGAIQALSTDEVRALMRRSDLAGWWAVVSTWAVILGTLAVLGAWPNPVTFVLALVVLGGRQLALAILLHEAAHRTLFRTRFLNDSLTHWLCAWPLWNSVALYRRHHLEHHKHTGTERDPDLGLAPLAPMSRASLARKLTRDVLGITGIKRLFGQALIACEVIEYTVATEVKRRPRAGRRARDYAFAALRNSAGFLLTNSLLLSGLALLGHAWLYWAWALAYLTAFSLFLRIRSLAEHACTARGPDVLCNTRTTRASLLARATVAPFAVNYHVEHHLLVAVPWFRLAKLHRLLRERIGVTPIPNYVAVLGRVSARESSIA